MKLAIYYNTTVKYGFKMELMQAFAKPIEDSGVRVRHFRGPEGFDVDKDYTHALIFNYQRFVAGQEPLKDRLRLRVDVWNHHKDNGTIWMFIILLCQLNKLMLILL